MGLQFQGIQSVVEVLGIISVSHKGTPKPSRIISTRQNFTLDQDSVLGERPPLTKSAPGFLS